MVKQTSEDDRTAPDEGNSEHDDRLARLEQENEQLRERLAALEAQVTEADTDRTVDQRTGGDQDPAPKSPSVDDTDAGAPMSRRQALSGLAGLAATGLLGAGATGVAAAASEGDTLKFGKSFAGTPSNGYGVKLVEQSGSGSTAGIRAEAASPNGQGVQGIATSSTGRAYG